MHEYTRMQQDAITPSILDIKHSYRQNGFVNHPK
jgi:hypothetical protein